MLRSNNQPPDPALVYIYPKDVQRLIPRFSSYSGAWKHYKKIKECIGKKKHQHLTVVEFAEWEGLPLQAILNSLRA